ncbi:MULTISPECIES: MEDS domain-containing protein [Paenibacillus]|uniref:histidine kinase n=1 Tax=Paenibacillus validus TaxID=44253 RepID=A0A7X2ZAH2_9BACL|nr:MEDS domain-containing protein [Paenibacillus validus]MUG71252.1 hypothetical protein [Paenibacillus validus]
MAMASISLTDQIDVSNGAHILYFYESYEGYLSNAVAFVRTGLRQGQEIVLIDSLDNQRLIYERLTDVIEEKEFEHIHFFDHREFYGKYGAFHVKLILESLEELFQPFVNRLLTVRSWGHVYWQDQADILEQLRKYECHCDTSLSEWGILGVCVYDGRHVPANVQNEMLKSHEYVMTDTSLAKSTFYNQKGKTVLFPSLAVHTQMQSEVDLYKQKLEFAHVVSHEVRNPLTVIKAYATLLQNREEDRSAQAKLQAIIDYVDVIDNEITHIINTEQMLSSESLWVKSKIAVAPIVCEVLPMMVTKARTQAIALHSECSLGGETILGNAIGLKLIISNLLSNAIKYSHEGGTVWFKAGVQGKRVVLVIRDQGIGMSEEQTRKLFRKYEKMNHEKSGQGIGLFMAKQLIDHFAGEIEIASVLYQGTEVTVRLPLSEAAS